ncbi:MAG: hypothetical protein RL141_492 [Candidatus Parcubacteria bacterium]|jgi:hypothetical protein
MFGIVLMTIGVTLEEAATSIGKFELRKRVETPFAYGLLTSTAVLAVFLLSAAVRWDQQIFRWESLPTLAIRAVLEVVLAVGVIHAIKQADRSTFGFLRTLTIPFLLIVDLVLAYHIDPYQITGMTLIVSALFLLFINHGFSKHGAWLTAGTALLAVATTSLYKYNITHFNSPEVEQVIMQTVLITFFIVMGFTMERKNPFRLFRIRACLMQAGLMGVGSVLGALSFLYAAPSVLMSVKRSVGIFEAIISGRAVFHEKRTALKVSAGVLTVAGFILLLL